MSKQSTYTYRGWNCEPAYIGWRAAHPDFDGDPECSDDNRVAHGNSHTELHAEIDRLIEEDPTRCTVAFGHAEMARSIAQLFDRCA